MRILLIDDDAELRNTTASSLKSEGFVVDTAEDGSKGSYMARINQYDVILLDNYLPQKDGLSVCRELREQKINTPVIIISVGSDVNGKVTLLNSGADDYVTKPYSIEELVARIKAVARRPASMEDNLLTLDDLTLDRNKQKVTRGKKGIYLTRKEFALLECLMRHSGKVVSRGVILENVWGTDSDPFSNTIEAHVLNLRRKIDTAGVKKLIHSVPGRGYKIDVER